MKRIWAMVFAGGLLVGGVVPVSGAESDPWEGLEDLFWECSEPGETGHAEMLRDFARAHGKTDAELAERLVEIIRRGAAEGADAVAADQAEGALWHLRWFGGEKEAECVREVMRTTKNGSLRQVAIHVGMQLDPEKWEEWVREVADDPRSGDFDRYIAYEEAFQVGQKREGHARRCVIDVLEELELTDSARGNRNRLGAWIAELQGDTGWEPWLREVVSGEGFQDVDRKRAFRLALQAGRNGSKETRKRVIEVFGELCEDESIEVDRAALRQWIAELEKLP